MKSENIIQIALGSIGFLATGIFGIVGWLAVNQYDMNKNLGDVNSKIAASDDRLSRIVNVLPDIKAKIAWEEHNNQINGFIAIKKPTLTSEGDYIIAIELYDRLKENLKIYNKKLQNNDDVILPLAIAGKVREISHKNSSFRELSICSAELKHNVQIPTILDDKNSFVIRGDSINEYEIFLKTLAGEPIEKKYQKLNNWEKLSQSLEVLMKEPATTEKKKK